MRKIERQTQNHEVSRLTPRLREKLHEMYELFHPESETGPYLGCLDMSVVVKAEFGLRLVEGDFLVSPNEKIRHFWNEDRDHIIIDFTRHQFNRNLPVHLQIPFDKLPIIYPNDPEYSQYLPIQPR